MTREHAPAAAKQEPFFPGGVEAAPHQHVALSSAGIDAEGLQLNRERWVNQNPRPFHAVAGIGLAVLASVTA